MTPMTYQRLREQETELHVLVVDDDPSVLSEACAWLGSEGHRVSPFARARGLHEVVAVVQPDVVLIDVLMPDLDGRSLSALLANSRSAARPIVILHSRIPEATLRTLTAIDGGAGVIQKTRNPLTFLLTFNAIVDRVRPPQGWPSRALAPSSGMHRILHDPAEDETMPIVDKGRMG